MTEGPYFVDEKLDRSDIRSDPSDNSVKAGVPLALTVRVMKVGGSSCTPLAGATVDVWHCDALGVYSDASDPTFGSTKGKKFLRGNKRQIDGMSRMQHLGSAHAGASPVIVAAMDNLKAALRGGARPWSASEAQAVAAAIDLAAERIRGLRQRRPSPRGHGERGKSRKVAMKLSKVQITTGRASSYLQQLR